MLMRGTRTGAQERRRDHRADQGVDDGTQASEEQPRDPGESLYERARGEFTAWAAGDPTALDRLVRLLTPMLWHIARAYGLDRGAAEDVVQSTWLALVRHRDGIQDSQAVVRWLTVTARREAWKIARSHDRVELADNDELDLHLHTADGPEATAIRHLQMATLWEAVSQLSERCQRLLRVIAFSERPDYVQLSGELRMPVGSIGPTRGRCLAKLRVLLGSVLERGRR